MTSKRSEAGPTPASKVFGEEDRRRVRKLYRLGAPLECPTCRVPLDRREVSPNPAVSYVRHRLVVSCPSCRAHLVLDRSEDS